MKEAISADFPFESRFVEVLGLRMHYIDVGAGDLTILLLHGNPTSSYLWRNVVPHLSAHARCVAPDLPGMGKSDKPRIAYRVAEHAEYIEAFIETLGLARASAKLVFVLHDWGSAIGLDWARRHEAEGVVAGLALMEILLPRPTWLEFRPEARALFKNFRTEGIGRDLIIDQNAFVERVLPAGVVRQLTEAEMAAYRAPFLEPASREPTWRFPNELPIAGEPVDVYAMAQAYQAWLFETDLPKLFFWATPGAQILEPAAARLSRRLRNCRTVHLGPGRHFVQEDNPHQIGREIAAWIGNGLAGVGTSGTAPPAISGSL